jgi:hypothetical protein
MKAIGFVIEHNIRTRDGRILPPVVISSEDYGAEIFNDLTAGEAVGTASTDHDLDGLSSAANELVTYDRTFVILGTT